MSFESFYNEVQSTAQGIRVSTSLLRRLAIKHSTITVIREQWSGHLDDKHVRGFYIEGPMCPPISIPENGALIALSRAACTGPNGSHWRRVIYTKELMHVFDDASEKADTPEKFDVQIQKLKDPSRDDSPQYRAELKAFWRALSVLCLKDKRHEYAAAYKANTVKIEDIANEIDIPEKYVYSLLRDDFDAIISRII